MRKIVNTLFVILAMASVTYGMILRYDHTPEVTSVMPEIFPAQSVALPYTDTVNADEYDSDMDLLSEPD